MRILIVLIIFQYFAFADSIYFMPYQAKEAVNALVKEIKKAQKEVNIAVYSFTNREISKALRDVAKNGVKVTIIYDYESNIKNEFSTIGYLAKLKNTSVCTLKGRISNNQKYYGKMHNKLAIIDKKVVIFGSANWSKSAFEINYEILLISQNKDYINKSLEYFDKILKECEKY